MAYRIPRFLFLAALTCSADAAETGPKPGKANSALAEELLSLGLAPDLTLGDLGRYADLDRKAVSTRRFGAGRIFDIPPNRSAKEVEEVSVHLAGRDRDGIVSVSFLLEEKTDSCSSVRDFARRHRLVPRVAGVAEPDQAMIAFEGIVSGSRVVAIPEQARPACIGELVISRSAEAGARRRIRRSEP
ncbi:hypothetical protein [uncultured Pseudoxanthomonas sp.]|uniref:hypothetical protein n=1 Tax=uncultured Pseudoxanthomonas sp. TaxID=281701 RepID=UPI002615194D|nr:hypothetical protein [uncultured Pseudoxanthomonas sp.]